MAATGGVGVSEGVGVCVCVGGGAVQHCRQVVQRSADGTRRLHVPSTARTSRSKNASKHQAKFQDCAVIAGMPQDDN
jgi:hypothetical protein